MKRAIKITLIYTFLAINLLMILAMNICVYSSYLSPHVYPNWSYLGLIFPAFLIINLAFIPFWLIFRRKFTLVPIAGMFVCAWAIRTIFPINFGVDNSDADLKIMTYNVMHMGDSTSRKKDPRENPILMYIINQEADIVCLQEALHIDYGKNLDTLRTIYPYIEMQVSESNFMAILSKFPILETVNLNDSIVHNRTFGYKIKFNDDTLFVINNHFESFKLADDDKENYREILENPEDASTDEKFSSLMKKVKAANSTRALQVDYMSNYIKNCSERNIIFCGDFNDGPISYTHNKMTKHLNDSYTRGGNGHGNTYNRSGMYFRIDNILVSENIKVCKAKVDKSINTSDHYPLISWLKMHK
ncbi:MAG: endonuclease/exonuclease/phosphatase family protein [Bacteroidaceae bacterium]|nr:endonuclease/exonuclease/phosphatase family protein [Bacteroidaceae bacterium]